MFYLDFYSYAYFDVKNHHIRQERCKSKVICLIFVSICRRSCGLHAQFVLDRKWSRRSGAFSVADTSGEKKEKEHEIRNAKSLKHEHFLYIKTIASQVQLLQLLKSVVFGS